MKEEAVLRLLQPKLDDIWVYLTTVISKEMDTRTRYKLTKVQEKIEEASAILGDNEDV